MVANLERPGEQQHERGEDVPEALLGGDAEHDPGEAGPDENVIDGHAEPEHLEGSDYAPRCRRPRL